MKFFSRITLFKKMLFSWVLAICIGVALTACAYDSDVVNHSFGFDVRQADQDADVLDYKYGNSKHYVCAPVERVKEGLTSNVEGLNGPMYRGEFLYVKWRNKGTGKIYEDTVDLRHRLPKDLVNQKVYFTIKGPQLFVYLIDTNERRLPTVPPNGPSMYSSQKVTTIYPDQTK